MKANLRLKTNIDDLLKRDGRTRRELAQRVLGTTELNRADSWISKIFGKAGYHTREIQTKYLDGIAAFFGLEVYQLFQPRAGTLTERRRGTDRRSGRERRIDAAPPLVLVTDASAIVLTGDEAALIDNLRRLQYADYEKVRGWIALARLGPLLRRGDAPDVGHPAERPAATTKRRRRRGERSET